MARCLSHLFAADIDMVKNAEQRRAQEASLIAGDKASSSTGNAITTASSLNVWEGLGTSYAVVDKYPSAASIVVVGYSENGDVNVPNKSTVYSGQPQSLDIVTKTTAPATNGRRGKS